MFKQIHCKRFVRSFWSVMVLIWAEPSYSVLSIAECLSRDGACAKRSIMIAPSAIIFFLPITLHALHQIKFLLEWNLNQGYRESHFGWKDLLVILLVAPAARDWAWRLGIHLSSIPAFHTIIIIIIFSFFDKEIKLWLWKQFGHCCMVTTKQCSQKSVLLSLHCQ